MKAFLRRCLSNQCSLIQHPRLQFLGSLLHDPRLWHFNRRSTVRGLAAGAFFAFIPVPWQMLLAASAAAWWRFNLPVAVAMVWITNPLTIPPIAFASYRLGLWLLGRPTQPWSFEPSLSWLLDTAGSVGVPLLTGSLALAVTAGILTFCLAHLCWRWHIIARFRRRRRVVPI